MEVYILQYFSIARHSIARLYVSNGVPTHFVEAMMSFNVLTSKFNAHILYIHIYVFLCI